MVILFKVERNYLRRFLLFKEILFWVNRIKYIFFVLRLGYILVYNSLNKCVILLEFFFL